MAYWFAVHETTGQTPARVIFGNDLRLPIDLKFGINVMGGSNAKEVNSILDDIMSDKMKAKMISNEL